MKKIFTQTICTTLLLLLCTGILNAQSISFESQSSDMTILNVSQTKGELLWDNTEGASTNGFHSCRWVDGSDRIVMADDFDVPAGETWIIEEIFATGFPSSVAGSPNPEYIGVEIYTDDGNKPGTVIYENATLTPTGGTTTGDMTIPLTAPFTINQSGKYWISIYGAYAGATNTAKQYYVATSTIANGEPMHRWDSGNLYGDGSYSNWTPGTSTDASIPSMSFSISGTKADPCNPVTNVTVSFVDCASAVVSWEAVAGAVEYKVSRDGNLVGTVTTTTFTDEFAFENLTTYTWNVVTVCAENESEPASVTGGGCVGIINNTLSTFSIAPNPATSTITVSANSHFNTLEVVNFLGQTIISQTNHENVATLDVSNLANGVYFVRIISDNGSNVKKFVKQ